jgi:hypothetical protein
MPEPMNKKKPTKIVVNGNVEGDLKTKVKLRDKMKASDIAMLIAERRKAKG